MRVSQHSNVDGISADRSQVVHIIRDARGDSDIRRNPLTSFGRLSPTPIVPQPEFNAAVLPQPAIPPPEPTSPYPSYPSYILDVLKELYKTEYSEAEQTSQLTLFWELVLTHLFPAKKKYSVVSGDLVPDLMKIEFERHQLNWETEDDLYYPSLSSERSGPVEHTKTLAVVKLPISTESPLVVVQVLPSPPSRSAENIHDEDVAGCNSLLTRSARTFDALAPYSPHPCILIISVYGPGRSAGGATRSAPQMSAVTRDTKLTSDEASGFSGGEIRMGWTDLHEVFGLWEQSPAAIQFLELLWALEEP